LPLEDKIHTLDKQKSYIEKQLCKKETLQNSAKIQALNINLYQTNLELDKLIQDWEILINKKENIEDTSFQDRD